MVGGVVVSETNSFIVATVVSWELVMPFIDKKKLLRYVTLQLCINNKIGALNN